MCGIKWVEAVAVRHTEGFQHQDEQQKSEHEPIGSRVPGPAAAGAAGSLEQQLVELVVVRCCYFLFASSVWDGRGGMEEGVKLNEAPNDAVGRKCMKLEYFAELNLYIIIFFHIFSFVIIVVG